MIKVDFHEKEKIKEENIQFAVVAAYYKGKIVVVRHKDRNTWEIPGGRKEDNETSLDTAKGNYLKKQEQKNLI